MTVPRGPWFLAVVLVLLCMPPAAAAVSIDLLETPDVIVANTPNETYNNPSYPFTVQARITNDDQARNLSMQAITYIEPDVDGCPMEGTEHPPPRVFLVQKRLELSPGESATIGGSTEGATASQNPRAYWPMAVSRTYQDRNGNNVSYPEGEHSFCVVAIDIDCASGSRTVRQCTAAREPFRAYVRRFNAAPAITDVSVQPSHPRPGQTVALSAEAIDNSTTPRQDTLSYTWHLDGRTVHGSTVQHAFASHGYHSVEIEVTDGFDTVNRSVRVPVGNVTPTGGGSTNDSPGAGPAAAGAIVWAALFLRRRRAS